MTTAATTAMIIGTVDLGVFFAGEEGEELVGGEVGVGAIVKLQGC
jgi:hypothetical protein